MIFKYRNKTKGSKQDSNKTKGHKQDSNKTKGHKQDSNKTKGSKRNVNSRLFTCDNDVFPYDQMVDAYNYAFKYIIISKNIP
jgi:hypothetical protein